MQTKVDAAEVIRAAATSPLGILALLCLIVAFLAHSFFARARERTRAMIFLIVLAIVVFATAIGFAASSAPEIEPVNPPESNAIEKAQAFLPVEQEIYATGKAGGGHLVITQVEKMALGYKISGHFLPYELDIEAEDGEGHLELAKRISEATKFYDVQRLPLKEINRISNAWACRQPNLRSLLDEGGEGQIAISMLYLGFGNVDQIECPKPHSSVPQHTEEAPNSPKQAR